MMNKIILTVGLPRSGKTTWAKNQGLPIVSPDGIRVSIHGQRYYLPAESLVWVFVHIMIEALLRAGHESIIVDACHCTARRRDQYNKHNAEVMTHVIETNPETCIGRARKTQDEMIIPTIERMATEWDLPRPESWDGWQPENPCIHASMHE